MKKLLVLFAVFALTAPVFAADGDPNVLITCEDEGSGVVRVEYTVLADDGFDPDAEGNKMRAIAFKITTSNAALIDAISDYAGEFAGTPTKDIPTGYSVFMGSIALLPENDPNVVSFGTPVAPSGDPGAGDDLPDAEEIVVELGTLYEKGVGTPPGTTGILFRITIDLNGETSTVLTIEGESTRGGDLGECVLESGQQANVLSSGCEVGGVVECYVIGQPRWLDENGNPGLLPPTQGGGPDVITQVNYDAWVASGKPDCWCCPHHGYGDANGDGAININDVPIVWNAVQLSLSPVRADINHDGAVNINDIPPVWNVVQTAPGNSLVLPNTCADCP